MVPKPRHPPESHSFKVATTMTIHKGMGQTMSTSFIDALDLLISNTLIIDHSGIYKANISMKGGQIYGIRKAGNVQAGVQENMAATEVVAGEGLIVMAGAVDTYVHFIFHS